MVRVSLFTNEICPTGDLVDRVAVTFDVLGQELSVLEGDPRFIQVGVPVYSPLYQGLIDFSTDGEEWARNLASAYRNGAVNVEVQEAVRHVAQGGGAEQLEATR